MPWSCSKSKDALEAGARAVDGTGRAQEAGVVVQCDNQAVALDQHLLRVAPVELPAGEARVFAQVLAAAQAGRAFAAGRNEVMVGAGKMARPRA